MSESSQHDREFPIRSLRDLPVAWRALLTCVVLMIGAGYAAALVNIVGQNELVDGKPGMSADDLILRYAGGEVEVPAGEAPPSRMLEMIGTAMRQYFSDDDNYSTLHDWLVAGATEADFSTDAELTPEVVLISDCLRCHAADSGEEIGTKSPFGPDLFTPEYALVSEFAAKTHVHDEDNVRTAYRKPRDWRALAMSTHAHLLAVPIFVVLLGALFLCTHWPRNSPALRTMLACAPLVLFLLDVACWWLARIPQVGKLFALAIGATGALFGVTFGIQWIVVMLALWKRRVTTL